MFRLQVSLEDDPTEVAGWLNTFMRHYEGAAIDPSRTPATQAFEAPADSHVDQNQDELASELARFRSNWPAYSERFMRVHDGLVDMGYVPVLPQKRKPTNVRNYIAYCLPTGQRVMENNSSTAYFVGTERYQRMLGTHEWLKESGQNLSVHFDTDEKVDFILELAKGEMG